MADGDDWTRSRSGKGGGANRTYSTTKTYEVGRILGNGSFGVVCEATCVNTGEKVAIKKVLQDPRYKNRELDIMRQLYHPNVVTLKDYFFSESTSSDSEVPQRFLSVVMEYVPDTVYKVLKSYTKAHMRMPMVLVKVYSYQMLRSVGYLHSLGVCHRDIKPQNLLVDVKKHTLKLCDFGSAKRLVAGESSVAYICSRFYRAPELMLGATKYTCAIDTWSMGCVIAELITGRPLFAGETSVDQLVRICRVLGSPTKPQVIQMNKEYEDFAFPWMPPMEWKDVVVNVDNEIPDSVYALLKALLCYAPQERLRPYDALVHPFFDQLREEDLRLPGNVTMPDLFNFSDHEFLQMSPATRERAIPPWYLSNGISSSGSALPSPSGIEDAIPATTTSATATTAGGGDGGYVSSRKTAGMAPPP